MGLHIFCTYVPLTPERSSPFFFPDDRVYARSTAIQVGCLTFEMVQASLPCRHWGGGHGNQLTALARAAPAPGRWRYLRGPGPRNCAARVASRVAFRGLAGVQYRHTDLNEGLGTAAGLNTQGRPASVFHTTYSTSMPCHAIPRIRACAYSPVPLPRRVPVRA